jgi:two-component system, NtrC family, nitrogen regulation sensor histidine kinase NtrY
VNPGFLWVAGLGGALLALLASWVLGRWQRRVGAPEQAALQAVSEYLPVGVVVFGQGGQIRYANEPARMLLFEGEDPSGRNFLKILAAAPAGLCAALSGPQDGLFSSEDTEGDQQMFQVLRRQVPLGGEPHVLLLINPLTREVARREVDLLKKVIRVINHELNNSLASLSSLASSGRYIVEHPAEIGKLGRVFDGIEGRTRHLQHFLSDYAALSRLPEPRPAQVQWEPLLTRLEQLYPEVQISRPTAASGWFDEVQLEQALINLLKNAVEAGGPVRQIKLVFRERNDCLELGILDRGTGFSTEALEQGVLPFYTTKEGGSGIGLTLCREVAEGHRGRLRIKAREGGGSAVYMILPLQARTLERSAPVTLTLTRT